MKVLSSIFRLSPKWIHPQGVKVFPRDTLQTSILLVRYIQIPLSGYNFTDYYAERKSFSLQVPEYFNFTCDFVDQWALAEKNGLRRSSNPALWWVDAESSQEIKLSFQQLSIISKRVANALTLGCGLHRKDRVIIILPKIPEWWFLLLGCIRADIQPSSGTVMFKTEDIQYRLELSQARGVVTIPEMADVVEEAGKGCPNLTTKIIVGDRKETRPGWKNFNELVEKASDQFKCVNTLAKDPMMFFFTSGTTGLPKMTEHSHSSYGLGLITNARYMLQINSEHVFWNWADTGWAKAAWSSFFAPWTHGATVFIHSAMKFDPVEFLRILTKYPVTHICCPPTAMRMLSMEKLNDIKFRALSYTICTAEPLNPELVERWRRGTGLDIYECYGQTETTLITSRPPCIPYRERSMGKACPGMDVDIIDDDGNVLDVGQEGNISIKVKPHRHFGLFTQYVGDPKRTAATLVGDYYVTGDRGYKDQDDYIFFVARGDDLIMSSGYRIGPFEVESALIKHPAVQESAVVSSPDEIRGEVVKAFVVLAPEFEDVDKTKLTADLQKHVLDLTAPFKYPRKIEYIKELPKTWNGKIRRVDLKRREWGRSV